MGLHGRGARDAQLNAIHGLNHGTRTGLRPNHANYSPIPRRRNQSAGLGEVIVSLALYGQRTETNCLGVWAL